MIRKVIVYTVILIVAGCARHVVVEPQETTKYSDSDWEIKSQPKP